MITLALANSEATVLATMVASATMVVLETMVISATAVVLALGLAIAVAEKALAFDNRVSIK